MDLSDSKFGHLVLIVNSVLLFFMFYIVGALAALNNNRTSGKKDK